MFYKQNRQRARTKNTKPSATDQSQARETDINVIVGRFLGTGAAPGASGAPLFMDATELPDDLRGFIETARTIDAHRNSLPAQLRDKSVEEILALSPDELTRILTPPQPEAPKEPAK